MSEYLEMGGESVVCSCQGCNTDVRIVVEPRHRGAPLPKAVTITTCPICGLEYTDDDVEKE